MKTHRNELSTIPIPHLEVYNTQLPNGLRLMVQPDDSSPVVSIQAWVETGSITEGPYTGAGISHFLEHMLFKGTEKRRDSEIVHTIQELGGNMNAYTSFDRTVFYINLPSTGWPKALDVITDIVFHSTLPADELAKEQEVIRREISMNQDDPESELQKLLFRTAYTVHPYRYPVIGNLELFNRITRNELVNYYKNHYVPENVVIVVSGDVDPREVEKQLTALTSSVEGRSMDRIYVPQEPKQLGKREMHTTFPTDVERVFLAWHIPAITDPDVYPLDVLSAIMGHGDSSRLHQELVEKKKILRSVDTFSYTPAQPGLWGVAATLQPKATRKEAEKAILDVLKKVASSIIQEELVKAKRQALASRARELKTAAGRASSIGSSWLSARNIYFDENYLKSLQKVTANDINQVTKKYFTDDNLTVASIGPDLKTKSESPKKIQANREIHLQKLSNGAKLIMVADPKVPLVTLRVSMRGGLLAENENNNGIGKLTAYLVDKGTKKRTAEKIAKEVEDLGGNLGTDFGNNSFSISVEVLESDLEKAVEILSDVVLNPTFPDAELAKEKSKQLTDIKLEADNPMALARNEIRKIMFGSHPYAMNALGTEETLGKIKRSDVETYYRKLLVSGNVVFSVGGSFDSKKAKALVEKYFAKLPKGNLKMPSESAVFSGKIHESIIPTPKEQAIIQIGFPGIALDNPDRAAMEIMDEALSDLGSRLFIRIREKQSLAYFVGTAQLIGMNRGYFLFYAGTSSKNSIKTKSEILDEIRLIVQKGFSAEEIERARAKLLGERLMDEQSASSVAYHAALDELYGLGANFESAFNQQIRDTSLEQINATAAKYFSGANYVSVIVQPKDSKLELAKK